MVKNVLIIGASGDIGIAIAKQLACKGYQLVLHYHSNRLSLDELLDEVKIEQILQVIQADLSKETGINKLLKEIVYDFDAIVFANGKSSMGLFQDLNSDEMDELLTLHVKSPLMITNKYLPKMVRKQAGKIIFITSIWGEVGASNEVLYSTVKGAQNSFVKALAKEVTGTGITVNAVSPGFIDTKMNASISLEERAILFEDIPLGRPGTTGEISDVVSYLLATKPSYLNGQIIQVSGGWYI